MSEKRNRKELRVLMAAHDLRAEDVALLLDRQITTVQAWAGLGPQVMPDHLLQLLEYKVADSEDV